MAGTSRNVTVNVIGNASGLTSALGGVATTGETTGTRLSNAFHTSMAAISTATGGAFGPLQQALDGVGSAIEGFGGKSTSAAEKMGAIGLGAAGAGAALTALGSKDQAAQQQLSAAISATGGSYDDYKGKIDDTVKSMSKYGDSNSETQNALQTLTQATHDPEKALGLMGEAANLAAAKHESLGTATTQMAQIIEGKGTKTLVAMGISLKDSSGAATTTQQRLDELAKMTAGQASAASDTFTGKMTGLKTSIENTASSLGEKYGPALTTAGAAVAALGTGIAGAQKIHEAFTAAQNVGKIATEAETAAKTLGTAATAAEGAADTAVAVPETIALGPVLLIIAAIAILVGGIYLLVTHWTEVWNTMKAVIGDAWHFMDSTFIQPIQHFFSSIVDFIRDHWKLILEIITGPVGLAIGFITSHFDTLIGFFTGLPGRVGKAITGMWDGIRDGFRTVINAVIDLWNKLHFDLPKIDLGPLGSIGGGRISVPHIDHLAAGGIAMSPTLAVVGDAGPEAIIPLSGAAAAFGGGGGQVSVAGVYLDGTQVGTVLAGPVRDALIRGQKNYPGTVIR